MVADLISDHHCHLAMCKPLFKCEERTYCKVKAVNPLSFSLDIINSDLLKKPEHSLEDLVCKYDHVLSELLDKHTPLKTKCLIIRPMRHGWMTVFSHPGKRGASWSNVRDSPGSLLTERFSPNKESK